METIQPILSPDPKPKKKWYAEWWIWLIFIVFIMIVAVVAVWYFTIRVGTPSSSLVGSGKFDDFSDCSKQYIEADQYADKATVSSQEPAVFVVDRLEYHLAAYTNAKVIKYALAITTWGNLALENTKVEVTGGSGVVRDIVTGKEREMLGRCVGRVLDVSFTYELNDQLVKENKLDTVSFRVNVDGQKLDRTFTVQPAVWVKEEFSSNASAIVGSKTNFQASIGELVIDTITLKDLNGQPLTGQSVSFKSPDTGYTAPPSTSTFTEKSPGVYQAVVTASQEAKFDMGIQISGKTPNPDFNERKLTFTTQVSSKTVTEPQGIQFSFNRNFLIGSGDPYMYLGYMINYPGTRTTGRAIKRVLVNELDNSSLPDGAVAFPNELMAVRPDGQEVALMNKISSSSFRLMRVDAQGIPQWPDSSIQLGGLVKPIAITYSPDGTKVVVQTTDGLKIINTALKKLVASVSFAYSKSSDLVLVRITNSDVIVGMLETDTYTQQSETTIYMGANTSETTLKPVDSTVKHPAVLKKIDLQTGAVLAEKTIHDDAARVLAIAQVPFENSRIYVLAGTVQELNGSFCKTYPVFTPGVTSVSVFNADTLDRVEQFTMTVPMDNFGVYIPRQLVYGNGKLYFVSLFISKYCSRSDEDILREERVYQVGLESKQPTMVTALLTNRSRMVSTGDTNINELFFVTSKYFIHLDRASSSVTGKMSQLFTLYSL